MAACHDGKYTRWRLDQSVAEQSLALHHSLSPSLTLTGQEELLTFSLGSSCKIRRPSDEVPKLCVDHVILAHFSTKLWIAVTPLGDTL